VKKNNINWPYPLRAIYPPIEKGSVYWQDYYLDCDAGEPDHYLNGGIWPYIGAFYVLALIKLKRFDEAEEELKKVAKANVENNFPEWIDPTDEKAHDIGSWQAWNAGAYILAYESFIKNKVLI
jgi:glycogen debranching enzyme